MQKRNTENSVFALAVIEQNKAEEIGSSLPLLVLISAGISRSADSF
ncbi:MAG: hypothetical protein CDV28_1195 [Candidatus Electronema aureum]|uniref:Uncharacterized protein n=1 Tax=Candidatus Electronema aureum TaxID=2005002 RepID=A0A521G113_9BACT|nr:MAG: hypothetical protein CDV28_1195 [Candidatus Electronema aureum]